jgi:hypothetical protein
MLGFKRGTARLRQMCYRLANLLDFGFQSVTSVNAYERTGKDSKGGAMKRAI